MEATNKQECTDCGWTGSDKEKQPVKESIGVDLLTCPKCCGISFFTAPLEEYHES